MKKVESKNNQMEALLKASTKFAEKVVLVTNGLNRERFTNC
jgi:hypothetical protein